MERQHQPRELFEDFDQEHLKMSEKLTCEDEQEYPLKDHSLVFWDDGGMSIHSSLFLTVEELSEDEVEVMVSKYWGKKLGVCNGTVYCTNSICE